MPEYRRVLSATIANGQSLSGAVNLYGARIAGLIFPAAWTLTGSGQFVSFEVSIDAATFYPLLDSAGNVVTVGVTVGAAVGPSPGFSTLASPWLAIKVRSGLPADPVAQGAERVIQVVSLPGVN